MQALSNSKHCICLLAHHWKILQGCFRIEGHRNLELPVRQNLPRAVMEGYYYYCIIAIVVIIVIIIVVISTFLVELSRADYRSAHTHLWNCGLKGLLRALLRSLASSHIIVLDKASPHPLS